MLPLPIRYFPDGTACWTKTCEYFAVFIIPLIQKKISNAASVVKGHSLTCVLQMNVNTHSCIRHLTPLYIFMIVLNFGSLRTVVTVCYIFISHHFFFFVYYCSHIHRHIPLKVLLITMKLWYRIFIVIILISVQGNCCLSVVQNS